MDSRFLRGILGTVLLLFCVRLAMAQSGGSSSPIKWTATAQKSANAKQSSRLLARVKAAISPGWHLYALDQEPGGPVRTAIQVPDGQPFTLSGQVQQPQPMMGFDPNFDIPVRYFEHEAVFRVPVAATTGSRSRAHSIVVAVSFQTCNERLCLPLTTVKVEARMPK